MPRDPIGRNKGTNLSPPPILNLMLGMAAADPIANAPALVRAYRLSSYCRPIAELFDDTPHRDPILPGQGLGLDLETLIDLLARPSAKEQDIRRAFDGDFRVTLVVGEALVATVERPSLGLVDEYDAKGFARGQDNERPRPTFRLHGRVRSVVPLRRIVHLDFSHFEVAAELWADSLKHGAVYQPSLLDDPSDGGPENETAASGPCRDQNAAVDSDQLVTELGGP